MIPNYNWIESWRIGNNPSRENQIGIDLIDIFKGFWQDQSIEDKSKTTKYRYSNALHALGGYLLSQSIAEDFEIANADSLILEHVASDGGPLIHHDEEIWQDELDMVCRKLYKYLMQKY